MNKQSMIHCSQCGFDVPMTQTQKRRCPQCGAFFKSVHDAFNQPFKSGPMSKRQLVLLMVLLPLLVVAMTVASWYLIKVTRMPSSEYSETQQLIIEPKPEPNKATKD